jgi:hypothetical protein
MKQVANFIVGTVFILAIGFGLRHVFNRVRGAIMGDNIYGLVLWHHDWNEALTEASSHHISLLVEFARESSPGCLQLGKKAWSRVDIATAAQDYVPVMVEIDAHPELAKQYQIATVPSLAVINPNSLTIIRDGRDTAFTPDELLVWLKPDAETRLNPRNLQFDLQNSPLGFDKSQYSP